MGGDPRPDVDTLPNLLALDPQVHNGGHSSVHGRRGWSEDRGYLIPKFVTQPGMWPVWLHGQLWVLLSPAGRYLPFTAEPPRLSEGRGGSTT